MAGISGDEHAQFLSASGISACTSTRRRRTSVAQKNRNKQRKQRKQQKRGGKGGKRKEEWIKEKMKNEKKERRKANLQKHH